MAETSETRTISVTTTLVWIPVTDPVRCACGHDHYGRVPQEAGSAPTWPSWGNWAPQWRFCEADCGCSALRRVPVEAPNG